MTQPTPIRQRLAGLALTGIVLLTACAPATRVTLLAGDDMLIGRDSLITTDADGATGLNDTVVLRIDHTNPLNEAQAQRLAHIEQAGAH